MTESVPEHFNLQLCKTGSKELDEEHERLRRLYGKARGVEQRRLVKGRIRDVAAQHGFVEASITYHPDSVSSEEQSLGQ